MLSLISEFGSVFEITSRLNTELYVLNKNLNERDPTLTLMDYMKVKVSFKELKAAMQDLDRSVDRISSEIPTSVPDFGIDPSI